jgi:hypothetical protein
MNFLTEQIAILRARMVVRKDFDRAMKILLNVGVGFNEAVKYLLQVKRSTRK